MPEPVVCLVDDDPSVLKAIARLLRAAGRQVATFASAEEFLENHDLSVCGCLVLDLSMPGVTGLQLQQMLLDKHCMIPIVFLSARGDVPTTVQAMKNGAIDFLTKPVQENTLLEAVDRALAQDHVRRRTRIEHSEIQLRVDALTPREREVLSYAVAGWPSKHIAGTLSMDEELVKEHRVRAMEKMQVSSLPELVRLAAQLGIAPKK